MLSTFNYKSFHAWLDARRRKNESVDVKTFDFEDGNGPIPAYQHQNPDGSVGGWVAFGTTCVSPVARIDHGARVFGNAVIGKNVWLMDGATVKDNAHVAGALILAKFVTFEGNAICRIKHQVRHPVYIGYHPFTFPEMIIKSQKVIKPDYSDFPPIVCKEHPIIQRAQVDGYIKTLIYTDDLVLLVDTPRGRTPKREYVDDFRACASPSGIQSLSWDARRNQVTLFSKDVDAGGFLECKEAAIVDLLDTGELRRILTPQPYWLASASYAAFTRRY